MIRTDRIYPVPLKPASGIASWNGWPEDVVKTLKFWNSGDCWATQGKRIGAGLSFRGWGVFKCTDCKAFCEPQKNGTAIFNGDELCDECLIARARAA